MTWLFMIAAAFIGFFVQDESTSRAAIILLIVLGIISDQIVRTIKEDRDG